MRTLSTYSSLVSMHHIVFALPFAIIGFLMALQQGYEYDNALLLLILCCVFFARNAAMSFNRYADTFIDARNERTKNRPIQQGRISRKSVLSFTILNCVLFVLCAYLIAPLVFALSFVALVVILSYSYSKRFTALSHFILGAGVGLAPIGAYMAVSGKFALTPLLLSVAVMLWVAGFDILYALQDEAFDRKEKLFSIPAKCGFRNSVYIARICHVASILLLVGVGTMLSPYHIAMYWAGTAAFALLVIWQHFKVRADNLHLINRQFFIFNGWSSVLFCIAFFVYYIKR